MAKEVVRVATETSIVGLNLNIPNGREFAAALKDDLAREDGRWACNVSDKRISVCDCAHCWAGRLVARRFFN